VGDRLRLVRVELVDASRGQRVGKASVQLRGEGRKLRDDRLKPPDSRDVKLGSVGTIRKAAGNEPLQRGIEAVV
jgi:hypothetical protein